MAPRVPPPSSPVSRAGSSSFQAWILCLSSYVCLEGNSAPCPSDGIHGYRCPRGSYCPAGSGLELPCEPGTFSPVPGASTCLPCPPGTSCGTAGTVQPLSCPRGERRAAARPKLGWEDEWGIPLRAQGICWCVQRAQHCPFLPLVLSSVSSPCTGYYCPGRSAAPLPCPEGTLNPLEGALAPTACRQCPVGRYCRGEANWEPDGEFG